MQSGWFALGALLAALAVGLGAFGAHGLRSRVDAPMLAVFETAVRYQMYHALALLAVGWASTRGTTTLINASGWAFAAGIVLFSGSLYLIVAGAPRWLGAITPLGGLAFIAGWLLLAIAALRG